MNVIAEFLSHAGEMISVHSPRPGVFHVCRDDRATEHGDLDAPGAFRALAFYAHHEPTEGTAYVLRVRSPTLAREHPGLTQVWQGPWRDHALARQAAQAWQEQGVAASALEILPVAYQTLPRGAVVLGGLRYVATGFLDREGRMPPNRGRLEPWGV